jgi:large subunit ribosomal protein L4
MAVVEVINTAGEKVSEVELTDAIYNVPIKPSVLHDVVKMQLANRRSATASVKHRGDVVGSTRKLFRQKGTGRARRGNIKSPLLKGGGVVFGPDNRKYAYNLPKKVKRLALKMALSSKLQENSIRVINRMELDEIKTKKFVGIINHLGLSRTLILIDEDNINLQLSAKNVQDIKIMKAEGLNVYDLLKYDDLVMMEGTVKQIEGRLLP